MRFAKRITALLVCILLCAASLTAFAHEVPDLNKTGSISLRFVYEGRAVPGGSVTAYRVGDVAEDDGNYFFTLSADFSGSGADLTDISSASLARLLADYAAQQRLSGMRAAIDRDGLAVFSALTPGLYLIVQATAAYGYQPVAPFLVSLPMYEGGAYVYDVDATPKMEPLEEAYYPPAEPDPTPEEPGPAPDEPVSPGEPVTPGEADVLTLPQTGQLNWPVPALSILGLSLFLLGWALRFGKSKEQNET